MSDEDKNIGREIIAYDGYTERRGMIIATSDNSHYMVSFEDGTLDTAVAKHSVKEKKYGIGYHFVS